MKKTIRYLTTLAPPVVGTGAFLRLYDSHPHTETKDVHTSTVVRVEQDGTIETLNTVYRRYNAG